MAENVTVSAVTSFSPEGFEVYGRTFLKSYLTYSNLPLQVYLEEPRPGKKYPKDKRLEYLNLGDIPGFLEFAALAPRSPVRGYRWDANKFGRKVFAQLSALTYAFDRVYWFDADVVLQKKLDEKVLRKWVDEVAVAYLGREGFHLCSSFVGYNTRHPDIYPYMKAMEDLYLNGKLFELTNGWTDCDAMEAAMKGLITRNICQGHPKAQGTANVFDLFLPGHHKKGNRKYAKT